MNRRWAGLWVGSMVIVCALCQPAMARYADPQGRFSIALPRGWQTNTTEGEIQLVTAVSPDGRARLTVFPTPIEGAPDLPQVAAKYEEFLRATQKGLTLKLLKESETTVAGQAALRREYSATDAAEGGTIVATFLKSGALAITLHASARGGDYAKFAPILEKSMQSLQLGATGGGAEVRAKLQALEKARAAGILSDAEYQAKKAELEAKLKPPAPQIDEATRQKLKALDAALAAGILSQNEYDAKKAALLGGAAPTPPPVTPVTPPVPPVTPPATPAMTPYRDPQQRFTLQYPAGWTAQAFPNNQGVAFMQGKQAVSILLIDGTGTAQQLVTGIAGNLSQQWQGYQQTNRPARTVCGVASPAISFSGTNPQGLAADGELTAVAAGGRGYVFILTVPRGQMAAVEASWSGLLANFAPGGEPAVARPVAPGAGETGWKTYRHATGVSFRYPPNWRVQEQNGFPQLIPPDQAVQNGAPLEMYFAFGEGLEGQNIQRPDDPRLIQYLDGQVKSLSAALARVGAPTPLTIPGRQAAIIDWEATAQTGVVRARTYVTILNQHVLALVGMGVKQRVVARDAVLRRVFATFQFGAAQPVTPPPGQPGPAGKQAGGGDTRLLGVWLYEKSFSGGRYGSVDVQTFVFRPDGTFLNQGQFAANLEHGEGVGGGSDPGRTTLATAPSRAAGRWAAANGVLMLTWASGEREQVRYYIEDPSQPGTTAATMGKRIMLVTTGDGEKQLWTHQK